MDGVIHIDFCPDYRPGDPEPMGYNQWHEWAAVQHRAGRRQRPCPKCGKLKFSQSLKTCCPQKGE